MPARNRVLIEFTKKTEAREEGARVWVDPDSAKSFVKKDVARVVDEKAEAEAAAAAAAEAEADASATQEEAVDEVDADADVDAEEVAEPSPSPFSFTTNKPGDD